MVDGSEAFRERPNNSAIRIMASLFGPMRGTYHGPYPTREEALASLEGSDVRVSPEEFQTGKSPYSVPTPLVFDEFYREDSRFLMDSRIQMAPYRESTVILGTRKYVHLLDRFTGKLYARYEK